MSVGVMESLVYEDFQGQEFDGRWEEGGETFYLTKATKATEGIEQKEEKGDEDTDELLDEKEDKRLLQRESEITAKVPAVMWFLICSYLSPKEVAVLSSASSSIMECCAHPILWKQITQRYCRISQERLDQTFGLSQPNWKELCTDFLCKWSKKTPRVFNIKVYVRFRPLPVKAKEATTPKTLTTSAPKRNTPRIRSVSSSVLPTPPSRPTRSVSPTPPSPQTADSRRRSVPQRSTKPSILNIGTDEVRISYPLTVAQEKNRIRVFRFDKVFNQAATQREVYDIVARGVTSSVIRGFNGTLMVYGQTGSGKTWTMFGSGDSAATNLSSEEKEETTLEMGIVPRTCEHILNSLALDPTLSSYRFRVNYSEIYQDKVTNLVTPCEVKSMKDIYNILKEGQAKKKVFATAMNQRSSRSHCIFTIDLTQYNDRRELTSIYHLVDLAGSERQDKTRATGQRFEEAKAINRSLSTLERCILALSEKSKMARREREGKLKPKTSSPAAPSTKVSRGGVAPITKSPKDAATPPSTSKVLTSTDIYIPYRDSELTTMLQEALGGNSQTTLLVTCSEDPEHILESVSTMRFGERTATIQNQLNKIDKVQELRDLLRTMREEVRKLEEPFTEAELKTFDHMRYLEESITVQLAVERKERAERKAKGIEAEMLEQAPVSAQLQHALRKMSRRFTDLQLQRYRKLSALHSRINTTHAALKTLVERSEDPF